MRVKFFFTFSLIFFALSLLSTCNLLGQVSGDNLLRGVVSDERGSPLVGATITIVDTNSGVISAPSGDYSIEVASSGIAEDGACLLFNKRSLADSKRRWDKICRDYRNVGE